MPVSKDFYYKLSSEIESERFEAATGLLGALSASDNTEDWDYALNRLVKGLLSTRQSARFGFSLALTELVRILILKKDYDLSISSFVQKLIDESTVFKSMKGKEARALLFGRMFGFQALLNSQLMLDANISSQEDIRLLVKSFVDLSVTRPWLCETAMFALCQFYSSYLGSPMANDDTSVYFLQCISDGGLKFTPEGLALYLSIPSSSRAQIASQVKDSSPWKHHDPMRKGNAAALGKALKNSHIGESIENQDEKPTGKGTKQILSYSHKVPFVWDLLLNHFCPPEHDACEPEKNGSQKKRKNISSLLSKKRAKTDDATDQIGFSEFWWACVDDNFFSEKTSPEKKYWGFEIFHKFFGRVKPAEIPDLIGPKFLRSLMASTSALSKLLNKVTTRTANSIVQYCQSDLNSLLPIVKCTVDGRNGKVWDLDLITKARTTDMLIGLLGSPERLEGVPEEKVNQVALDIKEIIISRFEKIASQNDDNQPRGESKSLRENELRWCVDRLLVLFRTIRKLLILPVKLLEDVFKFLVEQTFFQRKSSAQLSKNLLKMCSERLDSFLSDTIALKRKDHSWAYYCVKQIQKKEKDSKHTLLLELSEELESVNNESFTTLNTIKTAMKKDGKHKEKHCFELLVSMATIQLYQGEAEAIEILDELKTCYMKTFSEANDGLDISIVLTEITLSFISKTSVLMKKLGAAIWESLLCARDSSGALKIGEKNFELLFNILNGKENELGQKQLFDGQEEYVDEDGDENRSGSEQDDEDEAEEGSDSNDKGSEEDEKLKLMEQVEQETKIKLANALGIPTGQSGEVKLDEIDSFGECDDTYESESMDDEQMMAIDEDLARIFKDRLDTLTANSTKKKQNEKALAKKRMVFFKNRVLDLLDSFAKIEPNSMLILSFIRPSINVINSTSDKEVGMKAHKLLKNRISKFHIDVNEVKKAYPGDKLMEFKENLLDTIRWLQLQAGKYSSSQAHGAACNQSCIIVSKSLLALDPESIKDIISLYAETLILWSRDSTNRIKANMFFDFVNWLNSRRNYLKIAPCR